MLPLFSIILPTYNRKDYLGEAIESVMAQTYEHWELIIIDDGSTDDTPCVVKPYLNDRVRYHRRVNGGPAAARNDGIRQTSQESALITFLDDDDAFESCFLERLVQNVDVSSEQPGFGWCGITYFRDEDDWEEPFLWKPHYPNRYAAYQGFLTERYVGTSYGVFFKPTVFDRIGLFDEQLRSVEDTDFFLRALQHFDFQVIPEYLVRRRVHGQEKNNQPSVAKAEGLRHILDKNRSSVRKLPAAWINFHRKVAFNYYRCGLPAAGRKSLLSGLRPAPRYWRLLYYLLRYEAENFWRS